MSVKDPDDRTRAELLSLALKAVRAIRKAESRDLAAALGLSLRGYQHFESGGSQLNVDHVLNFGAALDCDPFGIFAAIQIRKPEFAAYVAQNKAILAWLVGLQEFVDDTGDAIQFLETATLVSAYRNMFKDLSGQALEAKARHLAWSAENAQRLRLPKPGAQEPGNADPDASTPEDPDKAS